MTTTEMQEPKPTDPPSTDTLPLLVESPWLLCNMSRTHWDRLEVAGKTPAALRLGRKKLYRRTELFAWVEAGCPERKTWQAMIAQAKGHK